MNNPNEQQEEELNDHNSQSEENMDSGNNADSSGEVVNDTTGTGIERRRRTKHRVKVKTRVRVKRKTDSKKRYKKLAEKLIWVLFIVGFVAALVVLYQQLGINDSKYKSNKRTMFIKQFKPSQLVEIQYLNKHNSVSVVLGI